MKPYNDYVTKYDQNQTIKLKDEINRGIRDILSKEFNLIEIDPKIVTKNNIDNNERIINFDNFEENDINFLNNNIPWYLSEKIDQLNFKANEGLYSYSFKINRDFIANNTTTNYEFVYFVATKVLVTDNNTNKIVEMVNNLVNKINNLEVIKNFAKPIKKIKVIDVNSIIKQYKLTKREDLLLEVVLNYESVLIFNSNGNNDKNIKFINDNISYGSNVATLFVYDRINNSIIKILTIYNNPNKSYLYDKLDFDVALNNENELIKNAKEFSDQIGFEFYISQYLLFCLSKFSIDEIID